MWSDSYDNLAFVPVTIIQRGNLDYERHLALMPNGTAFSWRAFRNGIRRGVVSLSLLVFQKVYLRNNEECLVFVALDAF